jgi:hypothetical protein
MAKATHALSAPREGRNPVPVALHEWRAAVFVWAALPPNSGKEVKVCRQLLELRSRLGVPAFTMEAGHA